MFPSDVLSNMTSLFRGWTSAVAGIAGGESLFTTDLLRLSVGFSPFFVAIRPGLVSVIVVLEEVKRITRTIATETTTAALNRCHDGVEVGLDNDSAPPRGNVS
jgi:hypothetical protein